MHPAATRLCGQGFDKVSGTASDLTGDLTSDMLQSWTLAALFA